MSRFEKHVFICTNKREAGNPKGCCSTKGSEQVLEKFKTRVKELDLNRKVRINSAGCLDACSFGTAIVVYPEQIWYGGVKPEDVEEIIQEHLINNKPVDRLLIKDARYKQC